MQVREVPTLPFVGQRSGTSGLRRTVREFQQPGFLENLLQSIFDAVEMPSGATLVLGGDGRYFTPEALQTAIRIAAANGAGRLLIGRGGLLSTPAASHLIRLHGAFGGLILSASHNPAGPAGDFGVKFNGANGAGASAATWKRIEACAAAISRYRIVDTPDLDLSRNGRFKVAAAEVRIIDPVDDHAALMERLFDFDSIRAAFADGLKLRFDAMNAVSGPYARRIFEDMLGAPAGTVVNAEPLPDFGGRPADPVPAIAAFLFTEMFQEKAPDIGAASDGDGDRNLILGRGTYVGPSDSLAILAAHAHLVPGYAHGLAGVARSFVTSSAVDRVAERLGIPCYAVPTGWKYFGDLLDSGRVTLCGEESFGTGSGHVREKDGLWAVLFWLNILARRGGSVLDIQRAHWRRYGRNYFTRHDYHIENRDAAADLFGAIVDRNRPFAEADPRDGEAITCPDPAEGDPPADTCCSFHHDGGRIVYRLGGTDSEGATLRVHMERYEPPRGHLDLDPQAALAPLIRASRRIARLERYGIAPPVSIS